MTLTSRDALWILDLLAAVGVSAWVDGGWGQAWDLDAVQCLVEPRPLERGGFSTVHPIRGAMAIV
jgi:hypothetical protein